VSPFPEERRVIRFYDDYEKTANEWAGPDAQEAVRAVAEALHANESWHMHGPVEGLEPCPYCWLRAGRAVMTLRKISGHPYFVDTEASP
jgi:hypothetical protein